MNNTFPLCYETQGNPAHPCIILIIGIGGQLTQWPKLLIEGLVKKNLFVVTFDNRDAGLSQYYDHLPMPNMMKVIQAKEEGKTFKPPYTLDDMANDVMMLMDHLGIRRAHIMGFSMGGMIAQVFALNHPERTTSLILVSTTSGDPHLPPGTPEVNQFFSSFLFGKNEKESLESFVENKTKIVGIYDPFFFNEEKIRAMHTAYYLRAFRPDGFLRQMLAVLSAEPRGEKLKQVKINTLVIHGAVDPVFPPEHGKYLAACLPNGRLMVIDKMGHWLSDELCEKIVSLIADFV